jgi:hypothetical protein
MTDTYKIEAEYTDTFDGEANYSWVQRAELEIPVGSSQASIMRRIKAAFGRTGARGRVDSFGDEWHFRPYRECRIIMARVVD